jgi:hypothetical protein
MKHEETPRRKKCSRVNCVRHTRGYFVPSEHDATINIGLCTNRIWWEKLKRRSCHVTAVGSDVTAWAEQSRGFPTSTIVPTIETVRTCALGRMQIMKLLIMQFSPCSVISLPSRSNILLGSLLDIVNMFLVSWDATPNFKHFIFTWFRQETVLWMLLTSGDTTKWQERTVWAWTNLPTTVC